MTKLDRLSTTNTLLNTLSDDDCARLAPMFERHALARGDILVTAGEVIEQVYFPEAGVASVVAAVGSERPVEVGLFGRDGVSAIPLLLGVDRSPHQTLIQVAAGTALRVEAGAYRRALASSATLHTALLRFVQVMLVQSAQNTVVNARLRIEARLARWLLMCHDRLDGDEIAITHDSLAAMIAAERSGVTLSLHILEGAGMVRSLRGRVTVEDRAGLEALAGDGYGVAEAEYRRLIGALGRSAAPPTGG